MLYVDAAQEADDAAHRFQAQQIAGKTVLPVGSVSGQMGVFPLTTPRPQSLRLYAVAPDSSKDEMVQRNVWRRDLDEIDRDDCLSDFITSAAFASRNHLLDDFVCTTTYYHKVRKVLEGVCAHLQLSDIVFAPHRKRKFRESGGTTQLLTKCREYLRKREGLVLRLLKLTRQAAQVRLENLIDVCLGQLFLASAVQESGSSDAV